MNNNFLKTDPLTSSKNVRSQALFKIAGIILLALIVHLFSPYASAQSSGYWQCYDIYKANGHSDFNARRFCPEFASHGYVECLQTYDNYDLGLSEGRRFCPTTAGIFYNDCLEFYVNREVGNDLPSTFHFSKARMKCSTHPRGNYLYCLNVLTDNQVHIMNAESYCDNRSTGRHVNCLKAEFDSGSSFFTAKQRCRNVF